MDKTSRSLRVWFKRLKVAPNVLFVLLLTAALYSDIVFQYGKAPSYADRVADAMMLNFDAYWQACKGHDEYEPQTDKCDDWLGLGITAIDSIDTLWLMGLTMQYNLVRDWASTITFTHLSSRNVTDISIFETVIRALGGLNSAYSYSGDEVWLSRARELGDLILPAFNTYSGCPETIFNPISKQGHHGKYSHENVTGTADAGTLQLEMRTLTAYSGDMRYFEAVERCQRSLLDALPPNRVVPHSFSVVSGQYLRTSSKIGGGVDSFIEMLLKTWLAFGKQDDELRRTFELQVDEVLSKLMRIENKTVIIGELQRSAWENIDSTMEHLTCFFPGTLALAAKHNLGGGLQSDDENGYITWARRLAHTCFKMTQSTPEGLAPERVYLSDDGGMIPIDETSLLRPEIVESLFVLHSVTDETVWRHMGKEMWDRIESNSTLPNGRLTSMENLGDKATPFGKLHSFVFAETLKYFYLLFSYEKKVDLSKMVFNTEAHPVPVRRHPPRKSVV